MHVFATGITRRWHARIRNDAGQGTVEYVLVMLAAAAMATALITWIGRTSLIPSFFSSVLRFVTGSVG